MNKPAICQPDNRHLLIALLFTSMFTTIMQSVHRHSKQTPLGISDHQGLLNCCFWGSCCQAWFDKQNVIQDFRSGFEIFNCL